MASVKLNATMQEEMVLRIDNYCKNSGMTRSAFLSMAATQYLDAVEKKPIISNAFGDMGKLLKLAMDGKTGTSEYDALLSSLEQASVNLKK